MRIYKYILGFFAVGFVLAFQGKISKNELYKAYFSAIEDVEVRNSHALSLAPFLESDYYFEAENTPAPSFGGLLAFAGFPQSNGFPASGNWDLPAIPVSGSFSEIGLLTTLATRAP